VEVMVQNNVAPYCEPQWSVWRKIDDEDDNLHDNVRSQHIYCIFCKNVIFLHVVMGSAASNRTTSPYFDHTEKKTHTVWPPDQNGWVSRRQENSDCRSPEWLEKASWTTLLVLDGHSEERPISAQPHLWGCYRNGPG